MLWTTPTNHNAAPTIQQLVENVNEKLDLAHVVLLAGPRLITNYSAMQSFLFATMEQLSFLERQLMAGLYQLQCLMETTKSVNGLTQLRTLKIRSDGWLICFQLTSLDICLGEMLEMVDQTIPQPF